MKHWLLQFVAPAQGSCAKLSSPTFAVRVFTNSSHAAESATTCEKVQKLRIKQSWNIPVPVPYVDQTSLPPSEHHLSHVDRAFLPPCDRTKLQHSETKVYTINSLTTGPSQALANSYRKPILRCRIFCRQVKWRSKLSHPHPPLQPLSSLSPHHRIIRKSSHQKY